MDPETLSKSTMHHHASGDLEFRSPLSVPPLSENDPQLRNAHEARLHDRIINHSRVDVHPTVTDKESEKLSNSTQMEPITTDAPTFVVPKNESPTGMSKMEEIRQSLRHLRPISSQIQSTAIMSQLHRETFQHSPRKYAPTLSSPILTNPIESDHVSDLANDADFNGIYKENKESIMMTQELLAFCEILDESRCKSATRTEKLRFINTELNAMLKNSNNREQENLAELKKQRSLMGQWQTYFEKLKKDAQETVNMLAEQRQTFKDRLEYVSNELQKYVIENNKLKKSLELDAACHQEFQNLKTAYSNCENDRKDLQAQVDTLQLENSKLLNERNALLSDKNRLQLNHQNVQDETDLSTQSLDTPSAPPSNFSFQPSSTSGEAPGSFISLSEQDIKSKLDTFTLSRDEAKYDQFRALLELYHQANDAGLRYLEYTEFLMAEIDRKEEKS